MLLQSIIREYLSERGWIIYDEQSPNHIRISKTPVDPEAVTAGPSIVIEGNIGAAKIKFCKLIIDFHDPNAFRHLDYCLKTCSAKVCEECPIKQWWLLSQNRLIVEALEHAE